MLNLTHSKKWNIIKYLDKNKLLPVNIDFFFFNGTQEVELI